jgi:hypothetical protein
MIVSLVLQPDTVADLYIDDQRIETTSHNQWSVCVEQHKNLKIIWTGQAEKFWLRIDGHLINPWLLSAQTSSNMISFELGPDVYSILHSRNIKGRIDSLGSTASNAALDRVVGRNLHKDLLDKISRTINEKSISS